MPGKSFLVDKHSIRYYLAPTRMMFSISLVCGGMIFWGFGEGGRSLLTHEIVGLTGGFAFVASAGAFILTPYLLQEYRVRREAPPIYAQDTPLLVTLDNSTERITGASNFQWVQLGRLMVKNNFRFRTRTPGLDCDFWRPILETRSVLCTQVGNVLDFTRDGKSTMRALSHLPAEPRNMPEGVFHRLTHTEHTE